MFFSCLKLPKEKSLKKKEGGKGWWCHKHDPEPSGLDILKMQTPLVHAPQWKSLQKCNRKDVCLLLLHSHTQGQPDRTLTNRKKQTRTEHHKGFKILFLISFSHRFVTSRLDVQHVRGCRSYIQQIFFIIRREIAVKLPNIIYPNTNQKR